MNEIQDVWAFRGVPEPKEKVNWLETAIKRKYLNVRNLSENTAITRSAAWKEYTKTNKLPEIVIEERAVTLLRAKASYTELLLMAEEFGAKVYREGSGFCVYFCYHRDTLPFVKQILRKF